MVSRLDSDEMVAEVETSMRLIRERVGVVVTSFAYPNGEPDDYDWRSIAVLRRLGLNSAVTTVNGFARPHQNIYELPRLYTTESSIPLFAARLEGFSREVT
jgi:peptidoglycan/xylan/chitin deacetylase (PgdA/CDA1 family)